MSSLVKAFLKGSCLPSVDHVFAEAVHILDFKDCAVVQGDGAVVVAVGLMALCARQFLDDKSAGIVVEGGEGKVESAVLTDKLPRLCPTLFAGEFLYVNSADFVGFAVIEKASFGGVGVVTYEPSDFKAEGMAVAVFVVEIG